MTATYQYDDAYRLASEIYKDASSVEKHRRAYAYSDGAGNRTLMTFTNSDSVSRTTTYSYGNREQLASHTGYLDWGTNDTGNGAFSFDARGNMTGRSGGAAAQYSWNEDNRLVSAYVNPQNPKASPYYVYFAYDYAGRRILKNVDGGASASAAAARLDRLRNSRRKTDASGKSDASGELDAGSIPKVFGMFYRLEARRPAGAAMRRRNVTALTSFTRQEAHGPFRRPFEDRGHRRWL